MKYVLSLLMFAVTAASASAQRITGHFPNPNLESIFPAGSRLGSTVDVRVAGRDLDEAAELRFSHPGITAQKAGDSGSKVKPGEFTVKVKASVLPGTYEVRVLGKYGLSTPRAFVVGTQNEALEVEPNDAWQESQQLDLETTVNGVVGKAGDIDRFKFTAEAGRRLIIRCRAESIDSPMEVAMTIRDEQQAIVAVDHDTVHRDSLIDFTPARDATYFLEVRDLVHEGSAHHVYRLTVTSGPQLDYLFPPMIVASQATAGNHSSPQTVSLYGRNLPGGELVDGITIDNNPIERRVIELARSVGLGTDGRIDAIARQRRGYHVTAPRDIVEAVYLPLPADLLSAGPAIAMLAEYPIHREQESNNQPESAEMLTPPVDVAGQFYPNGDRDWYRFQAKKGQTFEIDVVAQRMGVAADAFLVIQQMDRQGEAKDVASVDDQRLLGYDQNTGGFQNVGRFAFNSRTDDPSYRFVAPADGDYAIMVRELNHAHFGDPRFTYRLAIRPERPDFRVIATAHTPVDLAPNFREYYPWTPVLNPGGSTRVDLQVFRWGGFKGNVRVRVEGLPPGVSYSEVSFDSSQTSVPLVFTADGDAQPWAGNVRIIADAEIDGQVVSYPATAATVLWQGRTQREAPRSRIMLDMPLSVIHTPATLMVSTDAETLTANPGDKLKVPVRLSRGNAFAGPIQITNIGLPRSLVSAKPVTIGKDASEGVVELTVNGNARPGIATFCLDAKIDLPDPRSSNPKKAKSVALLVSSTPVRIEIQPK